MVNILSSKLYKSSPRQSEILAAIQDPNNRELVMQMTEYLDDEFIDSKYLNPDNHKDTSENASLNKDTNISDKAADNKSFDGGHSPSMSGGFSHLNSLFEDESSDMPGDSDDENIEDQSETDETEQVDETESSVESSTSVNACVSLNEIQGTLNSRQETSGVSRVIEKDEEIWIYYNDDINLNKVMSEAVQQLITSGYSDLEFNRLARSNNAIVFDKLNSSDPGGA